MNTNHYIPKEVLNWLLAAATLFAGTTLATARAEAPRNAMAGAKIALDSSNERPEPKRFDYNTRTGVLLVSDSNTLELKPLRARRVGEPIERKDTPWLGAAVEEAPAVLSAQLGLDPGVGLVVTYVATNSPAAQAGLQPNDVLVELEGQSLVLPAQYRKLVQVRKEGDSVKLVFYRAGKKHAVSATLGQAPAGFGLLGDGRGWEGYGELQRRLEDMANTVRDQAKIKIDQTRVQEEIRRRMEEARRAYQEALRYATNVTSELEPLRRQLEGLAKSKILLDNGATVTVRNTGPSAKSIVQTDEFGTIVIFSNPELHLTVHDKAGKLLFDGEINTPEKRAAVPGDLWTRVEPLLKKMDPGAGDEPQREPKEKSPTF